MSSVAGVVESTAPIHGAGPGSSPRAALQDIVVKPISHSVAKALVVRHHYLDPLVSGGGDGVYSRRTAVTREDEIDALLLGAFQPGRTEIVAVPHTVRHEWDDIRPGFT